MQSTKFNLQVTIKNMEGAYKYLQQYKDVPFSQIQNTLTEISKLFNELNMFLGVAFNDVSSKVAIINSNRSLFPQSRGFLEFITHEMQYNIHRLNGENNDKLKAPPNFARYVSTARSLLRMMWLMTFIKVFFHDTLVSRSEQLSPMLEHAYDEAFGTKHSWVIRNGAKLAIKAAPNRQYLMQILIGRVDEQAYAQVIQLLLGYLVPIWEALWGFYRGYGLVELE